MPAVLEATLQRREAAGRCPRVRAFEANAGARKQVEEQRVEEHARHGHGRDVDRIRVANVFGRRYTCEDDGLRGGARFEGRARSRTSPECAAKKA